MSEPNKPGNWAREELMSLLSLSGTLAGLCITVVAFMSTTHRTAASVVDDMLVLCAAAFLLCIYLIFWALRTRHERITWLLVTTVDTLFLASLTTMTLAAFVMVYTLW